MLISMNALMQLEGEGSSLASHEPSGRVLNFLHPLSVIHLRVAEVHFEHQPTVMAAKLMGCCYCQGI